MPLRPSVRQFVGMQQFDSYWTDFYEILMFEYFAKVGRENSSFIKIVQEKRAPYVTTYVHW